MKYNTDNLNFVKVFSLFQTSNNFPDANSTRFVKYNYLYILHTHTITIYNIHFVLLLIFLLLKCTFLHMVYNAHTSHRYNIGI